MLDLKIGSSLYDEEGAKVVPTIIAKAKDKGESHVLVTGATCGWVTWGWVTGITWG